MPDGVAAGSFHVVVTAAGGAALNGWGLRAINYHQLQSTQVKSFLSTKVEIDLAEFENQLTQKIHAGMRPPSMPGVLPVVAAGGIYAAFQAAIVPGPAPQLQYNLVATAALNKLRQEFGLGPQNNPPNLVPAEIAEIERQIALMDPKTVAEKLHSATGAAVQAIVNQAPAQNRHSSSTKRTTSYARYNA